MGFTTIHFCHAPDQLHIFLGRALNTEKEEATFNFLKTKANLTSNKKPDHVLYNSVARFQMQNEDESLKRKTKNITIETFYKPIKTLTSNTVVPFGWIESNSSEYQRLLERIANYLTQPKVWWQETDVGVEFFEKNSLGC